MSSPLTVFKAAVSDATSNEARRNFIYKALDGYYVSRDKNKNNFRDWQKARNCAAQTKYEALNNLADNLEVFSQKIEARGGKVFFASTPSEAREYILKVARDNGVKKIIKSKCMTSEEIHLNDALEAAGTEVVESDLGEFIQQLRKEPPFHFVFPCMHVKRDEINKLFQDNIQSRDTDNPAELTMIAREYLRQKYLDADMGITGANFIVAQDGMISVTENEGNSRLSAAMPKIHLVLVGIEKVVPRLEDLALFLPMLATAGAGQPLTGYNTQYAGPRTPENPDGPEQFHVVLLDNNRTQLLADAEHRDALHCMRCGACLNVCPVFKNIGGLSYGTTYQGPIGSLITPHLRGTRNWQHLSYSSSLCGACTQACPVKIDIHDHLLENRRNATTLAPSLLWKIIFFGFNFIFAHPKLYALTFKIAKKINPLTKLAGKVPGTLLHGWTGTRNLPEPPASSFRERFAEHKKDDLSIR